MDSQLIAFGRVIYFFLCVDHFYVRSNDPIVVYYIKTFYSEVSGSLKSPDKAKKTRKFHSKNH